MRSIKAKLLFTLIPIIIIALGFVSWINHNKAKEFLEMDFEEKAMLQLDLLDVTIKDQLQIHVERLRNIAKSSEISSMNSDLQLVTLKERIKDFPEYFDFIVADTSGNGFTTDDKQVQISDRDYYQEILSGSHFAISDPVVSQANGETIIVIATSIENANGTVGILGASISLPVLTEIVNNVKIGETGYAAVIQPDGLFIVHPTEGLLMKEKLQNLGVPALAEAYDSIKNHETGFKRYTFQGEERYAFYKEITLTGWGLLEVVPVKEATARLSYLAMLSFVTAGVVIIFSILVIVVFASRLVKPIRLLSDITTNVAKGDLTIRLNHTNSNDEVGVLGKNFTAMIDNMQQMLQKVQDVTKHVKSSSDTLVASSNETRNAAEQVAVTMQELASGTTDIASSVTNTTNQMTSMLATIDNISNYTDEVIETSEKSKESAEKGKNYSTQALGKMDEMNSKVLETAEIIRKLDEQSKEIGNIVGIITNIAEQTNLLALNASIEAARAGEHGKGFAVVAEEVRKLANETSLSAQKISSLIQETQLESKKAVQAANEGTKVVEEGTETVKKSTTVFAEIASHVDEVVERNKEIHKFIQQLNSLAIEIGKDMESISAVTEQASAGAEEVSAASEEQASSANLISEDATKLAMLAEELQDMMTNFKVK